MTKQWMSGPFLDITKYADNTPETITVYPELFEELFVEADRYGAFYSYYVHYYSEMHTYQDAKNILENFSRCSSCDEWYDRDELIDTEMMVGGGVGMVCESCVETLQ
jgi:hypothetical protein